MKKKHNMRSWRYGDIARWIDEDIGRGMALSIGIMGIALDGTLAITWNCTDLDGDTCFGLAFLAAFLAIVFFFAVIFSSKLSQIEEDKKRKQ